LSLRAIKVVCRTSVTCGLCGKILCPTDIVIPKQEKIEEDKQWDGLKGYLTNTDLSADEIYRQYSGFG
jgi:hypothetical protein